MLSTNPQNCICADYLSLSLSGDLITHFTGSEGQMRQKDKCFISISDHRSVTDSPKRISRREKEEKLTLTKNNFQPVLAWQDVKTVHS